VVNFYGYINDITKIKLSEQELKVKVKEEVSKNREKDRILIQQSKLAAMGEMIGNIAHQWRQPLNSVSLFLQFLKDNYKNGHSNEKQNEAMINKYFDKSFTQIQYMSQTIDDFRNFYKPSKQRESFSIKSAIESTLEIIKAPLKDEEIELILEIEDKELLGFENELKQSLLNIFNNAQDAIKQKREKQKFDAYIKVKTKTVNDCLEIFIKNNGGQIDEKTISRVFEPYFTTKFESQGTGIGLYMTKSIIETNMHGTIEVKNIENDSVSFIIKLPLNMEKM
jgi:signal transduction histidine kinase